MQAPFSLFRVRVRIICLCALVAMVAKPGVPHELRDDTYNNSDDKTRKKDHVALRKRGSVGAQSWKRCSDQNEAPPSGRGHDDTLQTTPSSAAIGISSADSIFYLYLRVIRAEQITCETVYLEFNVSLNTVTSVLPFNLE